MSAADELEAVMSFYMSELS